MRFDAVVVGAGPAGSTTALSLARAGRKVALIEKAAFPRRKVCGEFMSGTSIAVIDRLGLGDLWRRKAGPDVRRLALFSGERIVAASMPGGSTGPFGRALGRDVLDMLALQAAGKAGVAIVQPARVTSIVPEGTGHRIAVSGEGGEEVLFSDIVVAAHGSWEPGPLPTHLPKAHRDGDFLGFKAHFRGGRLDGDLMPLLFFPGGYGGMVWADGGRLSLSLCIRRDALAAARQTHGLSSASEAVFAHLMATSRGVRQVLGEAVPDGPWLAAGPIRPGIRRGFADGIFRVGNVAGESHPIIAEGISMAIQSGWLLAGALEGADLRDAGALTEAGRRYEAAWRRQFATRIRAAAAFSAIAVRPRLAGFAGWISAAAPPLLTLGAHLSGKTRTVRMGA
ncbi:MULTISPECIES: NAD(P)/FAD-dependent oxidoreductase [unclassified Aureimonas]|uniref:NAD(P)/FAD-dependent oxidoreductase n=1 Tax=unclassified Aureimonas TaxID=2615206 RepID=UPI0006F2D533|nr:MULTISPECIES: NAD(P)/FAD-dependent oxidoreductase [unclassified Aureimonas]KQT62038.1 monooxygenase [Aureimonas sp. Leaf460]KQT69569.1 monooxygenase [Aureimonas sp. Leaf427]